MGNPVRDTSHISLVQVVDDTGAPVTGGGGGGTGDASAANQVTGNNSLASIDTKLTNNATTTLQTTGNNSLSSIDGKITSTNTKLDTLITHVDTLETLIGATNTALAAANASLDDIEAAAENTAATLVQDTAYSVVRTITPGTNVAQGKALMVNCTTAGTLTIELQGGNTLAVGLAIGPAFFDKLAVIDVAWSGGGAGTAYVLDVP